MASTTIHRATAPITHITLYLSVEEAELLYHNLRRFADGLGSTTPKMELGPVGKALELALGK